MPCAGPVVGCPPREAALPPVAHYINAHYNFSTATCQTQLHWFQFTVLPLARLYRMSISLQCCHCQTFASVLVYSLATCQTLLHCFQFTALPLARLYFTGFSLQSCHSSDLMALVSVYSRATGQTLFHWFQFAILMLVRLFDWV